MRIITVLDSYPPDLNGGAYFTHRLARALQNRGHEVLVICPARSFWQGYTEYEGVRLFRVRSWPLLNYSHFRICWPLFIKKSIIHAITDFKPDLVHLQGKFFLGAISYRACRKRGIPLIATNHFMPENFFHYTHLPQCCENWFNKITWKSVLEMLSNVDTVTTPTHTAAQLLKRVNLKKEVQVISCGVDLQKFKPNQDASAIRQRFQIPHKPTLLYTGRLDKEKNVSTVIQAFSQARQQIDAHFVVVGRGAEKQKLKALSQSLGLEAHITFTDYLSDEEYSQVHGLADCFVNAGIAELQSIVALEAIASGLPLLGANAMALPELIKEGVNGYVFEPYDIDGLAKNMITILSNPALCKQMGMESRIIAESHDIAKTAEAYERLYQEMVKK